MTPTTRNPPRTPLTLLVPEALCAPGVFDAGGGVRALVVSGVPEGEAGGASRIDVAVAHCPREMGALGAGLGPEPSIHRARADTSSSCPLVVVADRIWAHELRRLSVTHAIAEVVYLPASPGLIVEVCVRVAD